MKASKFTDAQKALIIRQGEEGAPVAEDQPSHVLQLGRRSTPG